MAVMMFRYAQNMQKLRAMVSTDCPVIFEGNYRAEFEKGWRWEANLSVSDLLGVKVIKDFQDAHGKDRVTVGQPFDENKMKPIPLPTLCGLYIRDRDDLIEQLRHALDDDEALERWLSEDAN